MKGKLIHNLVMAASLEAALELKGYPIFCELPIRPGQRPPAVDLAFRANDRFIVFECERTNDRVASDVAKAKQIGADELKIIVPNATIRQRAIAVINRLGHCNREQRLQIQVMTLGAALQWVANNCPTKSEYSNSASGNPSSSLINPKG